jgi:hypothetical protein
MITWQILQMPEDTAEIVHWLDRQLVGLHLRELVSELAGVHGQENSGQISADEFLGEQKNEFMSRGFVALDATQLQQILTHPAVLFQLQDLVFEAGSGYWHGLQRDDGELQGHVNRAKKRVLDVPALSSTDQSDITRPAARQQIRWYSRPALASLATAASLLVAFTAYQWLRSPATTTPAIAWGWAKPGALPSNVSSAEYLDKLAASAQSWFNNRPEDSLGVARRISEFRQGCTVLLLADHTPLSDEEGQWLRTKCRMWADKLDRHLADLEAGQSPITVRNQVDATINSLIVALREQAETT